jgi:hypothetical protein
MGHVYSTDRAREAKIFLASRIAEEAERQGLPLSDLERKMLYYADAGWTLEDMSEVNDAMARQVDQRAYEKRIGLIIRALRARLRTADEQEYRQWNRSLRALKELQREHKENHYLLRLIAHAQPEGELSRLLVTALVVIGVMLLAVYLMTQNY